MSGNNWQEEAMRRLRQMQQARGGAGMGGGGPPQIPKGSPALLAAGVLLVGGAYVFSNSLFNVDGGQRAIKYRRVSGVSKEIYSEGEQAAQRRPDTRIPCTELRNLCCLVVGKGDLGGIHG